MARRGDDQDAGERKACQGWLYRYRLPRLAHGGTLRHKSPTPIGVRLVVKVYDVLLVSWLRRCDHR